MTFSPMAFSVWGSLEGISPPVFWVGFSNHQTPFCGRLHWVWLYQGFGTYRDSGFLVGAGFSSKVGTILCFLSLFLQFHVISMT